MKKRHYLLSILAIIIIGLLAASCTVQRTPDDTVPRTSPGTGQTRFVPRASPGPGYPAVPGASPMPRPFTQQNNRRNATDPLRDNINRRDNTGTAPIGTNEQDRAQKIADAAARIREVQSAACVVTGNTAMVGLQFNDQYKGDLTNAIKKQVEKRVRDTDKRIDRVVVTADPDMVSRIEEIFEDIGRGKPISGFTKELNEMINRISPR
ncbi:MAG TPA: YhcN/YlaJ family sporulation lipoprotein [Clostridiales bacterium]|jgi:YhcN/YlaJ family sporulation lipoprotein|nr:YhcN/YlaJ family sporulation lipoprotein [Clostridiales bacterium]